MKKEKLNEKGKKMKESSMNFIKGFKAFITRGNVVDMAIGVIIGGAFGAIITALIDGILMPLITAAIPDGGINGLVTVLNYNVSHIADGDIADFIKNGGTCVKYWGQTYDAAKVNIINWGSVINALIYFLAVGLILFIIIKVFASLKARKEKIAAKIQEEYYQKHPEKRPAPVEPGIPEPTDHEILKSILEEIKKK